MPDNTSPTSIRQKIWQSEIVWQTRILSTSFRNQPRAAPFLVVLVGIGIWISTYVAYMHWEGLVHLAAEPGLEAMAARRDGAKAANFVTLFYFISISFFGYGSAVNPVYGCLVYLLMPDRVYAFGQTPPEHIISSEVVTSDPVHFFEYAGPPILAAGAGIAVALLLGMKLMRLLGDPEELSAWWAARNFPPVYFQLEGLAEHLDNELEQEILREAGMLEAFEAEAEKGREIREEQGYNQQDTLL